MNRLRSYLVAGCAITALAIAAPRPARAQMAVFDVATFAQLVQEAENGVQQLSTLKNTLSVNQQQLTQLTSFYQSFAHLTNASQLAPTLLQQSTINPLPQVAQMEAALRGEGVGFTGNLGGSITTLLAKIQVYKPTGTDFAATQMNNAALASAGQMAAAQQLYSSSTRRIQGLQQLQSQLGNSSDPKQTLDLTARATIENGLAQAQTNQGLALSVLQHAQQATQQEQADQTWRQHAESLATQARTAASAAASGTVQMTSGQ
jgi:type IV secretion system protein VirB5